VLAGLQLANYKNMSQLSRTLGTVVSRLLEKIYSLQNCLPFICPKYINANPNKTYSVSDKIIVTEQKIVGSNLASM
jgi:hypothetical protein